MTDFLRQCKGGKATNLEELDEFFAALNAGPEMVMPSESYPQVVGDTTAGLLQIYRHCLSRRQSSIPRPAF